MIPILFVIGFVFLAAFFNAVMDATEDAPNFNESIFRNLNTRFWLKSVSWQYAKKIFGYKLDAWHIAKTCMVICISGAIMASLCAGLTGHVHIVNWYWWIKCLAVIGFVWNSTFILFYHKIFKIK